MYSYAKTTCLLSLALVMFGCSAKYSCLDTVPDARCAPLQTVYEEEVLGIKKEPIEEKVIEEQPQDVEKPTMNIALIIKEQTEQLSDASAPNLVQPTAVKQKLPDSKEEIVSNIKGDEKYMPILRPAKIIRVWIAPWVDYNGDLNMGSLVYTEVESKRWLIGSSLDEGIEVGDIQKINQVMEPLKRR